MSSEQKEVSMNFLDHLKELRQKLIYSIIFFLISFIVSFYFSQTIFVPTLISGALFGKHSQRLYFTR